MTLSNNSNVYLIEIFNHQNHLINSFDGFFFMGMVKEQYVILDEGTGASRNILLYDTKSKKTVLNDSYYGELQLIKNELIYFDEVFLNNALEKPECPEEVLEFPDNIGYAEKHIFNFDTLTVSETGTYICIFVE
ncbi:hypothetical protein [Abyssalbus ytuae]|uniref:Uncharacterized protein n=1 Tax=Abyssalbus ytuae TaxID=2926907 RepID=A0A9E6ZNB7_9FLAO|nr:hypothetical protein [Abyssalbus ytuae]UOB19079.1 hypothetical protein MQE35_07215 [Abyssalbus ytuae]